jgi:TatD DNase family protein
LALGYHPLAIHNSEERKLFRDLFHLTSFIGEVGLDFSPEGKNTRETQLADFRFIAEAVAQTPKVVSLHSRRAETAALDILSGTGVLSAIFHWYSGPLGVLDEALTKGHYFSVNPSMVRSEKGKRVIARIPPDRFLTETDGPYVRIGRVPATPGDVILVENYMASLWAIRPDEVRDRIWSNFGQLLVRLGLGSVRENRTVDSN